MLESHSSCINIVIFSLDGQLLTSALIDNMVRLWNTMTGALHGILEGHSDWVRVVAFSLDSQLLTSGSDDKMIGIWKIEA